MACSAESTPDTGGGGDLADRVSGGDRDVGKGVGGVREELERGEQARRDEQRLGDRGVPDGLGVGLGAVVREVDTGDGGEPVQPIGEAGFGQPGFEEAGGLCALTGRDNCKHTFTIS